MATFNQVQKAVREYRGGVAAANRIVEKVAGTMSLPDVDPAKFGAILRALSDKELEELAERNDDGEPVKVWTEADLEPTEIYARWNSSRAPSQD